MATNQLSTGAGTGTQTATQSPQTSAGSGTNATKGSSLQPGTPTSALNASSGGVSLGKQNLTTVSLAGSSQAQVATPKAPVKTHHANPLLFGLTALFFLAALILFWNTFQSVKSTTEY